MKLAALALVVGLAGTAAAEEPEYVVKLPSGWTKTALVGGDEQIKETWVNDKTDQVVVITRISGPTDGAWDGDETFFAAVESGVKKQYSDYERVSAQKKKLGKKKVPAYDLWFRAPRDGKKVLIGARFLFFKGYALSLVVDSPGAKRAGGATKKILESFQPPN